MSESESESNASAGMLTVEVDVLGGDEVVEVDEDGATITGEC